MPRILFVWVIFRTVNNCSRTTTSGKKSAHQFHFFQKKRKKMASSSSYLCGGSPIDDLIKMAMANGFKQSEFTQKEWLTSCKVGNTGPHKSGLKLLQRRSVARYYLAAFVQPAGGCQLCGCGPLVTKNCDYPGCKGKRMECGVCWFAECSNEAIHE